MKNEFEPLESCPMCMRTYDDIDFDFQCCSKCGWDAENETYSSEIARNPTEEDYINGDADILTGEWI